MEDAYNLKERKETCLQAMMEGRKSREKSPEAQQCGICGLDGKLEIQAQSKDTNGHVMMKQHSTVHFYAGVTDSSSTLLPVSQVLSCELPLSHYLSSSQMSGVSTVGQKFANSASQSDNSPVVLDRASTFAISNKHMLSLGDLEPSAIGEGEDYFFSLFGDSKRLSTPSFQKEKSRRHFSVILEEVGQSRSSALGDIKIAEVNAKGLFVKLVNSSLDKELEIGDHILQQNVNGQRVAMYRFLPNIIMPANSTVTAVAWYTPIHWKQTWEKLETDIEFERCSRVSLISQRQMFHWPTATKTTSEGEQDKSTKDTENFEMEPIKSFLKREKEIPPTLFPTRSPWCCSPEVPAHPYCTLIESPNARLAGSNRQAQPQSARPDPTQGPRKKGKLSYKSNSQSAQPLKVSKKPRDQKDDGCGPASPSYNRGSCSKQEHGFI
ncbi:lamin tail domain-containing protein 1 isoform X4 [Talpa occidentalis]|uniref:lamin tail domain-containing protein 1 isoform X4 n=1 Tax=Talpa occidentalis TaxID=50954 RepID=UPI0023F8663F|nr:lamin tail domain-containing protein 1 isoform X4 [Talpa occidentalis]